MITKNNEKRKCPFRNFKQCSDECMLYRKGLRYKGDGADPVPFEDCAINIMTDNIELTHARIFSLQQETADSKNILALKTLVDVGINTQQNAEALMRHINRILLPQDPAKQLK
jgi:hypothetical protein